MFVFSDKKYLRRRIKLHKSEQKAKEADDINRVWCVCVCQTKRKTFCTLFVLCECVWVGERGAPKAVQSHSAQIQI